MQNGSVGAALSRAIYIRAEDFLITITSHDTGNLPYGVLLTQDTLQLLGTSHPGDETEFKPGRIWFPSLTLAVDFSNAVFWTPRSFQKQMEDPQTFVMNLSVLRKQLLRMGNADQGLIRIAQHTTPVGSLVEDDDSLNCYCRRAMPVLRSMISQWKLGRSSQAAAEMHKLLGLGPGFTPSGDDFILGIMAVLWMGLKVFPDSARKLEGFMSQSGRFQPNRTTEVSQAFIKEASKGRFPERLLELTQSLAYSGPEEVAFCCRQLARLGATSGGDMVAGVLFGGHLMVNSSCKCTI